MTYNSRFFSSRYFAAKFFQSVQPQAPLPQVGPAIVYSGGYSAGLSRHGMLSRDDKDIINFVIGFTLNHL